MDPLRLLQEAQDTGLHVRVDGERLIVRGPRRAAALAQLLLVCKEEIKVALAILAGAARPGDGDTTPQDTGREHACGTVTARKTPVSVPSGPPAGMISSASMRFRFVDGKMVLGDICAGWTPAAWCKELRRKALRCEELHPETARYYREWAGDIERRGGGDAAG